MWVRPSPGVMREWTHPLMFEYLGVDASAYGDKPNADATLVGFAIGTAAAAARDAVYRDIVLPWKTCALVKDCIAPPGSSRANHRQDQAVLSYLVHRAGYPFVHDTPDQLAVRCKCDRWFYHYIGFGVPAGRVRTNLSRVTVISAKGGVDFDLSGDARRALSRLAQGAGVLPDAARRQPAGAGDVPHVLASAAGGLLAQGAAVRPEAGAAGQGLLRHPGPLALLAGAVVG